MNHIYITLFSNYMIFCSPYRFCGIVTRLIVFDFINFRLYIFLSLGRPGNTCILMKFYLSPSLLNEKTD